eukprot:augustus_masked-scaffold_6-processed-gene-0.13-mRNA-1 protein AED:1.00 eAED:1.00 QI:0/-1/0/0/-1/1/1/0/232
MSQFLTKTLTKRIKEEEHIKIGCPNLDEKLKFGFPGRGITEIYGRAGSGKTQILLSMILNNTPSLLVYTNSDVSQRLEEMAMNTGKMKEMDKILMIRVAEVEEFWDLLVLKLPVLLQEIHLNLVAVDSVAQLFGLSEFGKNEFVERTVWMLKTAREMKRIESRFKTSFVVVNEVRSSFRTEDAALVPALGKTWSSCITSRIKVEKKNMWIDWSPLYAKQDVGPFKVTAKGIE